MDNENKREISLSRAEELKARIEDYLAAKKSIVKGMDLGEVILQRKEKIKNILCASEQEWNDWRWQLKNRIGNVELLSRIITVSDELKSDIKEVEKAFSWSVSPYYCTLMDEVDPFCPVRLITIPRIEELTDSAGNLDPMHEEFTNPAGSITRRYPDRLIINATSECGAYCRFCQRRRHIGCTYGMVSKDKLNASIEYIRGNEEIRDVLITGGDPFTMKNNEIEWILAALRAIPHVEIIRIGTRTPITLPMRITKSLCKILKKYHPLYINTHFNHPLEICEESKKAVEKLVDSGIPVGNQMVLLNGINNDKHLVKCLNQELLKIRIKPYYIFHPKAVKGTSHYKCSLDEGIEIMEHLRGYTSGLAIPYYIVNANGGAGKVPILPEYVISREKGYFVLRTWEGKIVRCDN